MPADDRARLVGPVSTPTIIVDVQKVQPWPG
jgi:hypothetical protein